MSIGPSGVQVKGRVGDIFDNETHFAKPLDNVVALIAEVALEMNHFVLHELRLEELNGGFLECVVCTTVEIAPTRTDTANIVSESQNKRKLAFSMLTYALMNSNLLVSTTVVYFFRRNDVPLGPRIQAMRHPGRRKRLVRPSIIKTSSSFTSSTFSAAEIVAPSQSLV